MYNLRTVLMSSAPTYSELRRPIRISQVGTLDTANGVSLDVAGSYAGVCCAINLNEDTNGLI
jgi:hypothetical protein